MKELFKNMNCPYFLKYEKQRYEAVILIRENDYLIRFLLLIDNDFLCHNNEMIEGSGITMMDAVSDLKECLRNNELI